MMNMKIRRVLLLACCAVMLVAMSVGATLAYLTSSDSVTNTFTVGNVQIELWETDVNLAGEKDGETPVKANEYKLMPGQSYIKDPTVTVLAGSEPCYVGVHIQVSDFDKLFETIGYVEYGEQYLSISDIVTGGLFPFEVSMHWEPIDGYSAWMGTNALLIQKAATGDFYVIYTEPQNANTKLTLFDTLTIPEDWDREEINQLNNAEIKLTAYAVQAEGFDGYEALYEGGFDDVFGFIRNFGW